MPVRVFHGSILDVEADVIVCTANTELSPVAGLAKMVVTAAGSEVSHQLRMEGVTPLGHAVVTSAGRLSYKFIVHVTTRDALMLGNPTRLPDIAMGARNALRAFTTLNKSQGSVAFPLLGAGDVGLDRKDVIRTMGEVFAEFPDTDIIVCAYTPADREAAAALEGPSA